MAKVPEAYSPSENGKAEILSRLPRIPHSSLSPSAILLLTAIAIAGCISPKEEVPENDPKNTVTASVQEPESFEPVFASLPLSTLPPPKEELEFPESSADIYLQGEGVAIMERRLIQFPAYAALEGSLAQFSFDEPGYYYFFFQSQNPESCEDVEVIFGRDKNKQILKVSCNPNGVVFSFPFHGLPVELDVPVMVKSSKKGLMRYILFHDPEINDPKIASTRYNRICGELTTTAKTCVSSFVLEHMIPFPELILKEE